MNNRGYQPKGFAYTREIRSDGSRQIHPDDDNDAISLQSIEHDASPDQSATTIRDSSKNTFQSTVSSKGLFLTVGIIIGLSIILILPTILGVILTRNPLVTATTSTTTIAPNVTNVFWNFDSTTNDMYGVYNGALQNSARYSNTTYFGYGSTLLLNSSTNDSMIVTTPYLNLTYTSFTVEAWIYGSILSGDNSIFSQCACFTCQDQCLYLIIRNYKLFMSFGSDDVIGLTSLSVNTWYHVAFVYDYSTRTQSVYLQGILDNSKSSTGLYRGGIASITIGSSALSNSAFYGSIDNLKVTTRAKSASEILTAGTTVVYFSFDGTSLSEDMGPNKINGTISNSTSVTGKVGQGLLFNGTLGSYLQIPGFQQMGLGNRPITVSLWINMYSTIGGVIMQRQPYFYQNSSCYSMIGVNYIRQISMVVYVSGAPTIIGPVLSVRTWIHLGYTYSLANGLRMYVNGAFIATTGSISWWSSGPIEYLFVGSYPYGFCGQGGNTMNVVPFSGAIDELYVYRRELSAAEILALANPSSS